MTTKFARAVALTCVDQNGVNAEDRLTQAGATISKEQFAIGDICNEILEAITTIKSNITRDYAVLNDAERQAFETGIVDVYDLVAGVSGKTRRSIQNYHSVASMFGQETRDKYPALLYGHFLTAARMRDKWEQVLDTAVRYMDEHDGRLPTIGWLEIYFTNELQNEQEIICSETPPFDDFIDHYNSDEDDYRSAVDVIDEEENDPDQAESVDESERDFTDSANEFAQNQYSFENSLMILRLFDQQIERMQGQTGRLSIKEETFNKMAESMGALRDAISQAIQECSPIAVDLEMIRVSNK